MLIKWSTPIGLSTYGPCHCTRRLLVDVGIVTQGLALQVQICKIWHSCHTTPFDQLELLPYSDKLSQPSPVQAVHTSPYQPQYDGLVERFDQMMLRKVVTKEGKDWDKLLPYVLFAYRDVPQASTGFSLFELIYGHNVKVPMAVLKEEWVSAESQDTSVVAHIMQL